MTTLNLIILALAVHRLFRIIAADTITQAWRERILGWGDDEKRNRWPNDRRKLAEFVHCPWCMGFWLSIAVWLAFREWPHAVLLGAWPLAISSLAALIMTRVDS